MTRDDILRKVQKLLALATSDNEHEAAAALERAHALLVKYGVSVSDLGDLDGANCGEEDFGRLPGAWQRLLLCVLADAEGAVAFSYGASSRGRFSALFGESSSIIRCKALFARLALVCERMAGRRTGSRREAFLAGVVTGIAEQLKPAEPVAQASTAMVLASRLEATEKEFYAKFGSCMPTSVNNATEEHLAAQRNGIKAGRKIHLGHALGA